MPAAWMESEFELEGGERSEEGVRREELLPAAFGRSLKDWREGGGGRSALGAARRMLSDLTRRVLDRAQGR